MELVNEKSGVVVVSENPFNPFIAMPLAKTNQFRSRAIRMNKNKVTGAMMVACLAGAVEL